MIAGHYTYRRFGKSFHPAALNLGDCFSYALSRAQGRRMRSARHQRGHETIIPAGVFALAL